VAADLMSYELGLSGPKHLALFDDALSALTADPQKVAAVGD